jgi:hypothetical protein
MLLIYSIIKGNAEFMVRKSAGHEYPMALKLFNVDGCIPTAIDPVERKFPGYDPIIPTRISTVTRGN